MSIKEIALELLDKHLVQILVDNRLSILVSCNFDIKSLLMKYDMKIAEHYEISNCIQYVLVKNE